MLIVNPLNYIHIALLNFDINALETMSGNKCNDSTKVGGKRSKVYITLKKLVSIHALINKMAKTKS